MIFSETHRPTPQCHASTLAETAAGLVAAWFGGSEEKAPDVCIWFARYRNQKWQNPVKIASGQGNNGEPEACWNPVLFQPVSGPLMLFYKVGTTISNWRTLLQTSVDDGESWSTPITLPDPVMGPVKNKPLQLPDGSILCGGSDEPSWSSWQVYFSRTSDLGQSWQINGPWNSPPAYQAIQPTLLHQDNKILALCRTRQGVIAQLSSEDAGQSWSAMTATNLPNPNSGIDGVTLADGRHLVVYNHTTKARSPLNVAVSADGSNWEPYKTLEVDAGEYSYPAIVQTSDTMVHVSYTWRRRTIAHRSFKP